MFKSAIFFLMLLFITTPLILSQGRMTHEERLQQYKERLSLTADQTKKLDAILLNSEKKRQELRDKGDMESMRDGMMQIMEDTNAQITKILTAKQKVEFNKMIEERKNRMQQGQRRFKQ